MITIKNIQYGKIQNPPRFLIYGTEGIGKSTLASQAPRPIFIQTEDGLDQIECAKFPLAKQLSEVNDTLALLIKEKHEFQTIVIDSVDWLERLIWDALCEQYGVNSIERVDGGYGKGYIHALTHWRKIVDQLNTLRNDKRMCVILIAHAKIEKFEDPETATYDRYSPRLHKQATALLTEWCDAVLFATRKYRVEIEGTGFGRERMIAVGKDERILRTIGSPTCIAKNRYGLPTELPLSWSALFTALAQRSSVEKKDEKN